MPLLMEHMCQNIVGPQYSWGEKVEHHVRRCLEADDKDIFISFCYFLKSRPHLIDPKQHYVVAAETLSAYTVGWSRCGIIVMTSA